MENKPSQSSSSVPSAHDDQELLPEHAGPSHAALTHDEKPAYSGPITAILQWLSYAFWGWVAVALAALVSLIANYVLNGYQGGFEPIAYIVAGALVLTPIALVCDILFSKREEDHKRGIAMVIMVIHAVLYALLAVAALATTVFSLISILLSEGSATDSTTLAITAGTLVVFYGLLFIRIIKPAVKTKLRLTIRLVLLAIVLGAITWAIVGPVAQTYLRKDDRRTASAAQIATIIIDNSVAQGNKLPENLEETVSVNTIGFTNADIEQVKGALKDGLVTYTPNTKSPVTETDSFASDVTLTTYFYEICVTYKYDDDTREGTPGTKMPVDSDGYLHGLSGTSGKAGKHCYDLKAVTSDGGVSPEEVRL